MMEQPQNHVTAADAQAILAALHVEQKIGQMRKLGTLTEIQLDRAAAEHRQRAYKALSPVGRQLLEKGLREAGVLKIDLTPGPNGPVRTTDYGAEGAA